MVNAPSSIEQRPHRSGTHMRFGGLLHAEWLKFWTIKSLVVATGAAFVVLIAAGASLSALTAASAGQEGQTSAQFFSVTMSGVRLAAVIVAAMGVVNITGDAASGMLRTTLLAAPRRVHVLLAKALVLAAVVVAVFTPAVVIAYLTGNAVAAAHHLDSSISDPNVVRALAVNVFFLVGVAWFGLSLGVILQQTAAAIGALLAALFVLPVLISMLPVGSITHFLQAWWMTAATTNAGDLSVHPQLLAPFSGVVVFLGWIAIAGAPAAVALKNRSL